MRETIIETIRRITADKRQRGIFPAVATRAEIMAEVQGKIDLFGNAGARYIPFAVALTPNVMKALDDSYVYGRTFYSNDYADDVEAFKEAVAVRGDAPMKAGTVPGTDMNQ